MSNFIVIGDPHFQQTNMVEVNLFIEKLMELIKTKKSCIDYIVVLGDVLHFHERLHTTPLNKAYELIKKLREYAPVYILVGNHDYTTNQAFLSEDHWMNGMKEWKDVIIVDKVVELAKGSQLFLFVPYVPPGRFIEALKTHSSDYKRATAIFAHQEFQGCKMGPILSTDGDVWDESYPLVVSGHIHSKQTIKNVYYTGSAMQNAFGESEKNIIAYITYAHDGTYSIEENDLNLPRKKIVYKTLDEIDDYDLSKKSIDHIKLTISGTQEEFKAFKKTKKYKDIQESGAKISFKSNRIDSGNERIQDEYDFALVLDKLVDLEKSPYLRQVYEKVVHDKDINTDSIFYIDE